ncbi:efflux transporter outer membrane subunit [Sphingomonas sp. BK235]|uniref:efflux transporter outer membrane subunit n=1 Tax=Sphingomonas sp. BK235 TaxID=2512131 RepID=UPI001A9E780F|nr:efflux transporter outer membrane subunit [Sphingomonas sp. BK235]
MRRVFILSIAALLAGCVSPPKLGPEPVVRPSTQYETARSFQAEAAPWPEAAWWRAYGDPQLTLLVEEALASSPTMAQAAARLRRAEALVGAAGAATLPSVSADGSLTVSRPSTEAGVPVLPERQGFHDYGKVGLSFAWELDFWGKNRASLAAAKSDAEAARADAAAARLVISTSVAATYADLTRLFADRDVLQETLAVREKSLELVTARVAHGFDSEADLAQAQAGPPAARSELAQADEAIGLTRNRLASLLGSGPDRGMSIDRPSAPALKSFGLPRGLAADLLGHRPDVVAARWRVEAAGKRIKVAHAQFYPNINLLGLLGFEALGVDNLFRGGSDVGAGGPALSLPIFDGGRRRANYRGARADYDAAVALYDETVTQALRDVADVAVSSRQLAREIAGADEALHATERAYQLAQLRYSGGAADYQSVLLVEDRLLARRRVAAALRARAFVLDVSLTRSLGGSVLR